MWRNVGVIGMRIEMKRDGKDRQLEEFYQYSYILCPNRAKTAADWTTHNSPLTYLFKRIFRPHASTTAAAAWLLIKKLLKFKSDSRQSRPGVEKTTKRPESCSAFLLFMTCATMPHKTQITLVKRPLKKFFLCKWDPIFKSKTNNIIHNPKSTNIIPVTRAQMTYFHLQHWFEHWR